MSQKVFYRYNPRTEQYERVYPTRGRRIAMSIQRIAMTLVLALVFMGVLYWLVELPREKMLRAENERLRARVDLLDRRADVAISVLEELAERDNNFYRVMMGAEPLSNVARHAGLERQRLYESFDSLDDAGLVGMLENKLDRLDRLVYAQSRSYDFLAGQSRQQQDRLAHIPAIQPVPERFLRTMASGYGVRRDPIYGTMKFHEGMDFSAPIGTPVYATADGRVVSAGRQGLYGNMIEIDHGYNYRTRYAHLSAIDVSPGQNVHRGDLIGRVGNTGKSTGPHLHYEVRLRGQAQNPVNYYYYDLTPEQYDEIISLAENAGHVMD
ncbi:MAG: M23 family metallopeptidase [Muribaculaceae bacterium]|nr:M23 family metallopeptidase [Muribaculaceae bacterium]